MRTVCLVLVSLAGTALADSSPALDSALATRLARAGWADPVSLYTSPTWTVVTARKGKTKSKVRRVLIVGAKGAIVDGGVAPTAPTMDQTTLRLPGLVALQLAHRRPRANAGYDDTSSIWIVREDGTIACTLAGSSASSTGTACGSGGSTSVSLRGSPGAGTPTIDVTTQHSGTWSERRGGGACVPRSPVRSGPIRTRYVIPAKGTCKKVAAPKADPDPFDM